MNPTIQTLRDIISGRIIKAASDELHMAFMHHGDFETGSWSGVFDAQTAADLLPYAEAALANGGDALSTEARAALSDMVTFGANDDERVPYLLAELGCAFWDEGGVISIDSAAEKRWEAVLDALDSK